MVGLTFSGENEWKARRACLFTLSVCVLSPMLCSEAHTTEGVLYRALIGNYGLCWYLLAENRVPTRMMRCKRGTRYGDLG